MHQGHGLSNEFFLSNKYNRAETRTTGQVVVNANEHRVSETSSAHETAVNTTGDLSVTSIYPNGQIFEVSGIRYRIWVRSNFSTPHEQKNVPCLVQFPRSSLQRTWSIPELQFSPLLIAYYTAPNPRIGSLGLCCTAVIVTGIERKTNVWEKINRTCSTLIQRFILNEYGPEQ